MNEAATPSEPSLEDNSGNSKNSTRKSTPEFKIPNPKVALESSAGDSKSSKGSKNANFSAQYCNEVMNSDSIKPFNSGESSVNGDVMVLFEE